MILWANGFDHFGGSIANMLDGSWASIDVGWSLDGTHVRTGTYALKRGGQNSGEARRPLGASYTRVGVAMAVYFAALPTNNSSQQVIILRDFANNPQVTLVLTTTGALTVWNGIVGGGGSGGTLLGTSSVLLAAASQNHLEMWVDIGGADGAVEVRLNGATVIAVSGVNTDRTTLGEVSQFATLATGDSSGPALWISDLIVLEGESSASFNNDFIGDKKVYTSSPDADTADQDWTPSTGTDRYAMIDELDPDADATYDQSDTAGDVMGVTFPDLPGEVVAVSAVLLVHKSRKTDAGTCDVKLSVKSGADEDDGADRPMTTAYALYHDVFETDPATGLPWTIPGANAMAVKLTRTA